MTSENFKNLLTEWDLEEYTGNFESEGITDDSFLLLDENSIKGLIPKLGPRLIFSKRLKDYLSVLNQVSESQNSFLESIASSSSGGSTGTIFTYIPDDDFCSTLGIEKKNVDANATNTNDEIGEPPIKIPKINANFTKSPFPKGLEEALKKYPDGKIVLDNRKKLNSVTRNKITKIIITELYSIYGIDKVKSDILQEAAKEIEYLFPSEKSEIFYVPYDPVTKSGPKGKLYTKLVNTRSTLKLANSLSKTSSDVEEADHLRKTDTEDSALTFLRLGTEPISKVLEAWGQSYNIRQKVFLNKQLTEIYENFPCLRLNCGLEIIETDFNKKHPDSKDIIYSTWSKISDAINKEAKERNINVLTTDSTVNALLTLPYLFNPLTIKKGRKGLTWRPSRSEVQESFFSYIDDLTKLDQRLSSRKEKLDKYNINLQPFGVLYGELASPKFIIVVDDVRYMVDTGIRALEVLFKFFHGLDVEYPTECEHLWLLLEELVFKIQPKKKSSVASAVVADLQYHLNFEKCE